MMRQVYLGVDLTSSQIRPTAYALLDESGTVCEMDFFGPDEELLQLAHKHQPAALAIDAPLGLPLGWYCLEEPCTCGSCIAPTNDRRRATEMELLAKRIPFYWTTRRSIIKKVVYRGIGLRRVLEESGFLVLEVFPYATKVRLWGKRMPKKNTAAGLLFVEQRLLQLLSSLARFRIPLDHDLADALLAAYTAWLHARGETETLGLAEEGQIVIPKQEPSSFS